MMLVVVEHSEASPTTIAVAGSVGNTDEAWNFPLYGTGIFVVPNSDPSLLPTFYVSDGNLCVVRQIIGNQSRVVAGTGECLPNGADSVPGTESTLYGPTNMYYDATTDFLYILDSSSIRLLDMKSGIISKMLITFSGTNLNSFSQPSGITMFNKDIYVADTGKAVVWKVQITYRNVGTATISVGSLNNMNNNNYCDNVYATTCKLIKPTSISFFPDGTKAIADGRRVIIVTPTNSAYEAPVSMSMNNPVHVVAYDASNLLISDLGLARFIQFNKDQAQPNTNVVLSSSWARNTYFGLVKQADNSKNVYFLTGQDYTTKRSQIVSFNFIDSDLPSTSTTPLYGMYDSGFQFDNPHNALSVYMPSPQQMRLTSSNQLYFPIFNSAVVKVDLNSGLVTRIAGSITQFGYNQDSIPATIALMTRPNTVLQLDSGDLIISDTGNNRIRKIDSNGIITTIVGTGTQGNSGDYGPASQCQLNGPQGLATPPTSMKGQFLFDFADTNNNRIRRIQNDLTVIPLLSNNPNNDGINGPNGIMYTPNGDLYIASQGNNKIMKYSNSQLSTVAGNGYAGYSGDGGPARNAKLNYPADVTVSSTGEVYIADWGNRAVRKVFRNGTIITLIVSGNGLSELNGVTLTPNGDLLYSTQLWVKLYMEGDSGSCIDKNTCNNHGSCVNGKCVCDSGWRGNLNCGTFSCDITPPPHSSQCIGPNQFSCQDGWTGLNCQEPVCFGTPASTTTVCSSHGQCISNNTCNCVSGWRGNSDCSAFSCDITPPPHSSQCIGPNQFSCQDGWTGLNCQEPVCFGTPANTTTVCSSHGKCISNNTCNCVSGWRGNSDCSAFSCDVKSEHGEYCIGPNTYKCQDGWIGDLCDIPLCNGIPANNPAVCNSHGQCISNNTCNCFSGWRGNSICTQFTCDGVNNCQPHGQCISNNTCKCSTGYGGNGCNDRMCFGKWGQAGCSNNGYCSNTDKCSCFPLYFGQQCQWLDCNPSSNDQSINSTKGCSSNGNCTVIDNDQTRQNSTICKCNEGFDGLYCQEKKSSGNGGTVAAVVIVVLLFICCLIAFIAVGGFVYYKKRASSKSEEFENLIPKSVDDDWTLRTVIPPEEATVKSTASSVKSENSFIRSIRKQLGSASTTSSVSTINTRDHFHIRDKEYVKSKKLGSGASGTVFMFDELTNKEQVAVKIIEVLNPNGSEFKEVVNMFELSEEANPHIVPILGCTMVENGGYICILMPLYKCDLRNWMYSNKETVPIEIIVEIVKQIASALQYLHSKNMVHRDLKQSNIFVSKSPDLSKNNVNVSSFQLCVGDWGSSRYQTRSSLTAYEGTIQYSSPESIVKAEFSPKSDVWSLGCILYQLLSADYNTCLMRVKQTSMNDQSDVQIIGNVEKFFSKRSDHSHKLYKIICDLMLEMLRFNPEERISTDEIVQKLSMNNV